MFPPCLYPRVGMASISRSIQFKDFRNLPRTTNAVRNNCAPETPFKRHAKSIKPLQSRNQYTCMCTNIYYIQHTNDHTINWELEAKGKFGTDARTNSSMDRDYTWYCKSSEAAVGDGVCLERFPHFSWIWQDCGPCQSSAYYICM